MLTDSTPSSGLRAFAIRHQMALFVLLTLLAPGVLIAAHLCAIAINLALGAGIASTAHVGSSWAHTLAPSCSHCF